MDVQLFIDVEVGTPPQEMKVIVDSGSTWFWVQTTDCASCGGHAVYDKHASSSCENTGAGLKFLYYGSGNVRGMNYRENVCLTKPACEGGIGDIPNECQEVCIEGISTVLVDY